MVENTSKNVDDILHKDAGRRIMRTRYSQSNCQLSRHC